MTPKGQSARDSRMRRTGFADGYGNRPARYSDATYQQAWRKGREAQEAFERDLDATLERWERTGR